MPRFVRLLLSLLALLAWSAHVQGAPTYQALKFDGQFAPQMLNDLGQVAGIGQDGRPVIWNPDGSVMQLAGAVSQLTITGFNNQGTIIGNAMLPGYNLLQPVMWRNGGAVERLPLQGLGGSTAGINKRGDIVGYMVGASDTGSGQVGFIQWGDGSAQQLFNDYRPRLINDLGLVIGGRSDEFGARTWQDGVFGEYQLAYDFEVRALNSEGRLAGFQDNGNAFTLLMGDGQWQHQDLWSGYAYGINDAGSAVGEMADYRRAMLWHQGHSYVMDHVWNEEQYAAWFLQSAWDINASGQVLARAGSEWEARATFLLSPVPEPAQGVMLLAGLGLLGFARIRPGRRSA